LFALRELTGKDLGSAASAWTKLLPEKGRYRTIGELAASPVVGEWKRFLLPRIALPAKKVEAEAGRLAAPLVKASPDRQGALLSQLVETEGAAATDALAEAISLLKGEAQENARRGLVERFLFLEADSLRAKMKADDTEVRAAAVRACILLEDRE